jgi:hypothetical protein
MHLPGIFNAMNAALKEMQLEEILRLNEASAQYGLTLTASDVKEIIAARNQALRSYGRVELDMEVARKLILSFCSSPLIAQEDYPVILADLQEIFYYLKNETDDAVGDDELIRIIKDFFENSCGGELELLRGQELDGFVRDFKRRRAMGKENGDDF